MLQARPVWANWVILYAPPSALAVGAGRLILSTIGNEQDGVASCFCCDNGGPSASALRKARGRGFDAEGCVKQTVFLIDYISKKGKGATSKLVL